MHKSYKYILVFLTTVLVFCTIFSVQKVSAQSNLQNEMPVLYNYLNSTEHLQAIQDYKYLIVVKEVGIYIDKPLEKYSYYYTNDEVYSNDLGTKAISREITIKRVTYYHKYVDSAPYLGDKITTKLNTSYISFNSEKEDGYTKLIYTNMDIKNLDDVIVYEKGGNIDPLVQPPLYLISLEELPQEMTKGAMTILPVGLVVLSILLGIVLIPRLINYFRH